jgi:chemotaxis protein methyltransferase CheR
MSTQLVTFTLADLVRRCSAIELPAGKEYLVESRLLPLVRQADLAGVDQYVDTLRTVPHCAEHDRVVDALTTNETCGSVTSLPSRP